MRQLALYYACVFLSALLSCSYVTQACYVVQVNYHPSKQYDIDDNGAAKAHGHAWGDSPASGHRVKQGIEKENNFAQPGEYYRSFDRDSKDVFQKHLIGFMTHPKTSEAVQKTWIGYMHKVMFSTVTSVCVTTAVVTCSHQQICLCIKLCLLRGATAVRTQ